MLKIKEWKYDDMMSKVTRYGDKWMEINSWEREEEFGTVIVDEDKNVHYTGRYEVVKETAKAFQISFEFGAWTEWFPKSAVVM